MHSTRIRLMEFLRTYGQALSRGDGATVAMHWATPAAVVSAEGVHLVSNADEIAVFFSNAARDYHARGIVETRAEIEKIEQLGAGLLSIDVRWPALDAQGVEQSAERSRYVLSVSESNEYRIRVAIMLTE
jgi:hypothetical protein